MFSSLKSRIQRVANRAAREALSESLRHSSIFKAQQALLFNQYRAMSDRGAVVPLDDAGFRAFSQVDEDGIILGIFGAIGMGSRRFVDIGAADGINSNCANLAINWGWDGLFVDGNAASVERGRGYYARHPDTRLFPPRFLQAFVTRTNVNQLISGAGFNGAIDLLSLDIDGNDYWIWEAIDCIDPRAVVVEASVQFGLRSIVVPYAEADVHPDAQTGYYGASVVAMAKLAARKGYRLVAANKYGFNLFFVKANVGVGLLPDLPVEAALAHPRNAETARSFGAIEHLKYVEV